MSDFDFSDIPVENVPNMSANDEPKKPLLSKRDNSAKASDDAPKAKRGPGRPSSAKKRASTPKHGAYKDTLEQIYGYAGMSIMLVDSTCGTAVMQSASACAQSLDDLAYTNESVRRVLDTLTQGSAWSAVIVAHMPILMAVAGHHGFMGKILPSAVTESKTVDNDEPVSAT